MNDKPAHSTDSPEIGGRADAAPRQWVEKVAGSSRRARLTHVAGTDPSPEAPLSDADSVFDVPAGAAASGAPSSAGPNDDRLRRDKPPHW